MPVVIHLVDRFEGAVRRAICGKDISFHADIFTTYRQYEVTCKACLKRCEMTVNKKEPARKFKLGHNKTIHGSPAFISEAITDGGYFGRVSLLGGEWFAAYWDADGKAPDDAEYVDLSHIDEPLGTLEEVTALLNQSLLNADIFKNSIAMLEKEVGALKAQRHAYASEFPRGDTGNIHENIRLLKAENVALKEKVKSWENTSYKQDEEIAELKTLLSEINKHVSLAKNKNN